MRVVLVAFEGAQTLDVLGPAEVFAAAARHRPGAYEIVFASTSGAAVTTTSGARIATEPLPRLVPSDVVILGGGPEAAIVGALRDRSLRTWLLGAARVVTRLASVCTGAFVLADAGLLDGRRAATHWSAIQRLARFRPQVEVDREAIWVHDGRLWTSAGVTTGIDMALGMVEADHGAALADRVAADLVLYVRRPGFQTQFSDALAPRESSLDGVLLRARARLKTLAVPALAKLAGVSVRTLHRRCLGELGVTPAKLIERIRVEHAKTLLATTQHPLKAVARDSGFGSADRMRRACARVLGLGPREVRLLFERRVVPKT